jgi:hypothetical protein
MALVLLQAVRGAVVAIQWYGSMHRFETAKKTRASALEADDIRCYEPHTPHLRHAVDASACNVEQ